ncbi:hypothetical protein BKA57DRAFT_49955 [Linnemannia elongata]|nr:hypothetical protein BKA57DRAFT_49955 [Linnemannia elongata]
MVGIAIVRCVALSRMSTHPSTNQPSFHVHNAQRFYYFPPYPYFILFSLCHPPHQALLLPFHSLFCQPTHAHKQKKKLVAVIFFFPPVDHHVLYRCTNRKRNERNDKPDKGRVDRFLLCVRFALLFSFVRWFDVLGGWMIVYKREERVFFPYCSQVFFVVVFGLLIILLCMKKEMGGQWCTSLYTFIVFREWRGGRMDREKGEGGIVENLKGTEDQWEPSKGEREGERTGQKRG